MTYTPLFSYQMYKIIYTTIDKKVAGDEYGHKKWRFIQFD